MANSASLTTWLTQSSTLLPTYSSSYSLEPRAAPRCLWPCVEMLIAVPWKLLEHPPRFGNKPTFLSVWVVSQIRPFFSQFVPPLLYRFQRSGTTCFIGISALFHVTGDTQACNQGLKADGVNRHCQGIPLCCAFGRFELASSCYKCTVMPIYVSVFVRSACWDHVLSRVAMLIKHMLCWCIWNPSVRILQ